MTTDIQQLADGVSTTIREWCERRFDAFAKSFRQPVDGLDGKDGRDGVDGKDANEASVEARVLERILRQLEAIPAPKDGAAGAPGSDGRDGIDGRDGKDGAPGAAGADGRNGIDGKDGAPGAAGRDFDPTLLEAAVRIEVGRQFSDVYERVLRAIPPARDGTSVTLEDVTPLLEGEVSKWELEFERRANELLQRALDKLREPRDGKDAIGLADFDLAAIDGGRTIQVRLRAADGSTLTREVRTALMIDRGLYAQKEYQAGDSVTYGGHVWVAQVDTSESPGDSKKGMPWRLVVRKGKDGVDLRETAWKAPE